MGMPLLKAHCTKCGEQVLIDLTSYENLNMRRQQEAVKEAENRIYIQLMDSLGLAQRPTDIKEAVYEALAKAANEEKRRADKLEAHMRELTTDLNKTVIPATQLTLPNIAVS